MAYKIRYLEDYGVLETIFDGKVRTLDVIAAIQKNVVLMKRYQASLFLADCRTMRDTKERVLENYKISDKMAEFAEALLRNGRDAIILPDDKITATNLRFFETIMRNRMLQVKVFETRKEALKWLLS